MVSVSDGLLLFSRLPVIPCCPVDAALAVLEYESAKPAILIEKSLETPPFLKYLLFPFFRIKVFSREYPDIPS